MLDSFNENEKLKTPEVIQEWYRESIFFINKVNLTTDSYNMY